RVFKYLYTSSYSETNTFYPAYRLTNTDNPKLLRDLRVYVLTNIFFLEELKNLTAAKLQQELNNVRSQYKRKIISCNDA
ncbi:hypothetical protein DM02DRAFT_545441, partial [Periconia macrospinosa]